MQGVGDLLWFSTTNNPSRLGASSEGFSRFTAEALPATLQRLHEPDLNRQYENSIKELASTSEQDGLRDAQKLLDTRLSAMCEVS